MNMKITIPNPCSEDWQTMTVTEKGRFCAVCQKCVIDFTTMTDAEIIRHLNREKGETCGRFTLEQLNRPLTPPNRFKIPFSKWVLASTFSLSFMSPKEGFAAQTLKPLVNFSKKISSQAVDNKRITDSLIAFGTVVDSSTHEPIVGATVRIKGTTIGIATDFDGNFSFNIPSEYQTNDICLNISYIGYEAQEIILPKGRDHEKLEIKLKEIQFDVPKTERVATNSNINSYIMRKSHASDFEGASFIGRYASNSTTSDILKRILAGTHWYDKYWYRIKRLFRKKNIIPSPYIKLDESLTSAEITVTQTKTDTIHTAELNQYNTQPSSLVGEKSWRLSPNPARDMVVLDYDFERTATINIEIFNEIGQVLTNYQLQNKQTGQLILDVSSWQAGIYNVSLRSGSLSDVKRLVVVK